MDSGNYIEVNIVIDPLCDENVEIAEAEIAELPYDTFMFTDYGLNAYIQQELFDPMALKAALQGLEFKATFTSRPVPPQNWNEQWENSFGPIVVGETVTVKSTRHKDLRRTRFNITLDPQMAFGTGHHQTTYMMIERMLEIEDRIRGMQVIDMGCGTAVLGILAAKMGASEVCGIDIDAVATISARENARINKVSRKMLIRYGDASLLQTGSCDVLLANIHRNIIIMDLRTYAGALRPWGTILLSGFYTGDEEEIIAEAQKYGLELEVTSEVDDWCCMQFCKTSW